jgi:membrane-associated phospholipid phosphatase
LSESRTTAPAESEGLSWSEFPFRGRSLQRLIVAAAIVTLAGLLIGFAITGFLLADVGVIDAGISAWFESHRSPAWDDITWVGSNSADILVKVPAAVVLTVFFALKWRRWYEIALLDGALLFESLVFVVIAMAVDRARPAIAQLDSIPPTGSFPSGHAAAGVAFYGAIALIIDRNVCNRLVRAFALGVAIAMPLVVGLSRVYRGMHYMSDVAFGLALGAISLWLVWDTLQARERTRRAQPHPAS